MTHRKRFLGLAFPLVLALPVGCGDDGGPTPTPTIDDFLPATPIPDGTPQSVWAGAITSDKTAELIPGTASQGLVGDYYMRNSRARFVIQNEQRAIGVSPWGGNIVDAAPLAPDGSDLAGDGFGELSMIYLVGRTCAHDRIEVVLDGSGGGPAVIRARGRADINDYVNLKGMGAIAIPNDLDPDVPDDVDCATTYTLWPDRDRVEVAWTLFNGGELEVAGPFGVLNDIGGENSIFYPRQGMFHMKTGFEALTTAGDAMPLAYAVYQGPEVAYGVIPAHALTAPSGVPLNAAVIISGVSVIVFGVDTFLDILRDENDFLHVAPMTGVTHSVQFAVGLDGADIEASYQEMKQGTLTDVSGSVAFAPSGAPGSRARVGIYLDRNADSQFTAEDLPLTYFDADADGNFAGRLPAGSYFVRADVADVARSQDVPIVVGASAVQVPPLDLPDPMRIDYRFVDDETGATIPGKLQVIGRSPVAPDPRVHPTLDRNPGVIRTLHSAHGASVAAAPGDPADAPLLLPAGGPYRIFGTRGPEWSFAQIDLPAGSTGDRTIELRLRRVIDTAGYVATEFHQHTMASPDSAVDFEDRLASLVAEGIEFFASTDHDFIFDFDPLIDDQGLRGVVDASVGIEATPFAYGHFQAYPLTVDPDDPTRGAIDWAQGTGGFAMLPSELWAALRTERGARVIQVNHPRAQQGFDFQNYFDRTGLVYDFDAHSFFGNVNEMPVPADWLRLPGDTDLFSDSFDVLEAWNGFNPKDTDGDGQREIVFLDRVLRDYLNLLSFGKVVCPLGNSDTHTYERDVAGLPRTLIRVSDDTAGGLMTGLDDEIYDRMLGATPIDVVVTDGPMLRVTVGGDPASVIGTTIGANGDPQVTLEIEVTAPDWMDFDTLEIFVNSTFDPIDGEVSALQPLQCMTTRDVATLAPSDPCLLAPLAAGPMTVDTDAVGGGFDRKRAVVSWVVAKADIPRRTGATGEDAWIVIRVRGQRALWPLMVEGAVAEDLSNLDALTTGDDAAVTAALDGRGVPAVAFTGAIFVDFDGGGFTAPFAP